jgi:hypothetical protein
MLATSLTMTCVLLTIVVWISVIAWPTFASS